MIRFSVLKGYQLRGLDNENLGKVVDLVVDKEDWRVRDLVFRSGLFRKPSFVPARLIWNTNISEKAILSPRALHKEDIKEKLEPGNVLLFSNLLRRQIYSGEGYEIGTVYDCTLFTYLTPWKIESLHIDRRLLLKRIGCRTKDIWEITDQGTVILTSNYKELTGEEPDEEMVKELEDAGFGPSEGDEFSGETPLPSPFSPRPEKDRSLKVSCPICGKPVEANWYMCLWCSAELNPRD